MTTKASDNLTRANQSGFGTSSGGDIWGAPVNGNATAAIASNLGVFGNFNGDTQMLLGSQSLTDINILCKLETSDTGNVAGVLWRYTSASGGNGYHAGLHGGGTIDIDKFTNGSRSSITSVSFTSTANTFYWIRVIHTSGNKLYVRAWADGSGEPSTWNVNGISESSFTSGGFGASVFINSGGTVSYSSLTVTDNQTLKDIATRFILSGGTQVVKDLATRFRLQSANQLRDLSTRFRLRSADQIKDLSLRFRLAAAGQMKDLASRFRVMSASQFKDLASRFRVSSAFLFKDIASRFRLSSGPLFKDLSTRFRLKNGNTVVGDLVTRFLLGSGAPVILNALVEGQSHSPIGGLIVPVLVMPSLPYSVNGTVLDTQPSIKTAPISTSQMIVAGTKFFLGFTSPSMATQTLLTNGNQITLQFCLSDGHIVSAPVQVESSSSGAFFSVFCTVTQGFRL